MSDRTVFDTGKVELEPRPDFELDPGRARRSHAWPRMGAGQVPTGAGGADPIDCVRHLPAMQEDVDPRLGNSGDGRLRSQWQVGKVPAHPGVRPVHGGHLDFKPASLRQTARFPDRDCCDRGNHGGHYLQFGR